MIGADATNSHIENETMDMILNHLRMLRAHPFTKKSAYKVIIESNYNWLVADRIQRMIKGNPEFQPIQIMSKDPKGDDRPGVFNDHNLKYLYVKNLQHLVRDNKVWIADNFVSTTPEPIKRKIAKQFANYRMIIEPSEDPDKENKYIYTGKTKDMGDDLLIAIQMAHYWDPR